MGEICDFITVENQASYEFIEKKSKFIGYVKPTASEESAINFINEIKMIHRQATHNVYAFTLRERNFSKFSDDGEPQGTAGLPVLEVLRKQKVVDATIVVTRYFGGTLLGTGGLVRAYSKAAKLALEAGKIISMGLFLNVTLECDYASLGKISSCICDLGGSIDSSDFTNKVSLRFHIAEEQLQILRESIAGITSGSCELKIGEKIFCKKFF